MNIKANYRKKFGNCVKMIPARLGVPANNFFRILGDFLCVDVDTLRAYANKGFPKSYCSDRFAEFMALFYKSVEKCMEIESLGSQTVVRNWELYRDSIITEFYTIHDAELGHLDNIDKC